jgi:Ca2+/Na+ antiporter
VRVATRRGQSRENKTTPAPAFQQLVQECRNRLEGYTARENGFSGILLKKRQGFSKVPMLGAAWSRLNFVIDSDREVPFRYINQRGETYHIPLERIASIDIVRGRELHLHTHMSHENTICLQLQASDPAELMMRWFDEIVVKVDELGHTVEEGPPKKTAVLSAEDDSDHQRWYMMPSAGVRVKVLFLISFPVKAIVFLTVPDVLSSKSRHLYPLTLLMSIAWLGVFAFLMGTVIEYLGCGFGLDTTFMGLSVGAVGTSFPNFYASFLLAKSGQGSMAMCQAIAANTFNICICLGAVWLIHTLGVGSCDYGFHGAYHASCGGCFAPFGFAPMCPYLEGTLNRFASAPGSTKGALLVSVVWMVLFVISLLVAKMRVLRRVGLAFLSLYFLYIGYQLLAAYSGTIKLCLPNFCL